MVFLNGEWDFALDASGVWRVPSQVDWRDRIQVPFSPETDASGIRNTGLYRVCWYRRRFAIDPLAAGERLMLWFEAVDYSATVALESRFTQPHRGAARAVAEPG